MTNSAPLLRSGPSREGMKRQWPAETINMLFRAEVIWQTNWSSNVEAAGLATLDWVDWYKSRRLFSLIGNVPPVEFEKRYSALKTRPAAEVGLN